MFLIIKPPLAEAEEEAWAYPLGLPLAGLVSETFVQKPEAARKHCLKSFAVSKPTIHTHSWDKQENWNMDVGQTIQRTYCSFF